ncbi:MAG TPA: hypothetical protein VK815_11995 [Candidatus Acidoferrales bacterium]|nr:hypothetical protein [Candidatus Acidoferrales bacterium]
MAKLKLIVAVLLLAGVAIFWVAGHQSEAGLQAALQQQVDRAAQLKAEHDRLSNLVAQADSPAANQSLPELLRLRGEVTRLRQQTNELQRLQAQNERLQSAAAQAGTNQSSSAGTSSAAPARTPLAVYPKSTWAFAGYATPEATFQSMNWAALNGNLDSFLSGLSPDAQQDLARQMGDKPASEAIDELKNNLNKHESVSILSKNQISDSEVELEIQPDGGDGPEKLTFKKIDGQWKFSPPVSAKPTQP